MRVSEIFGPVTQGEGYWLGQPSIFVRTFGCNLRCPGFGVTPPIPEKNKEVQEVIANLDKYETLGDVPLFKTGCDTAYSVYPEFKKFCQDLTPTEVADLIVELNELDEFGDRVHLVFTGGEPLLHQKDIIQVLMKLEGTGLGYITFETNGTQELSDELAEYLQNSDLDVTFSVSPKLSCSGESKNKTFKPDAIRSYDTISNSRICLKFVAAKESDFEEIDSWTRVLPAYEVFIMPEGSNLESLLNNYGVVEEICLKKGYRITPRLQVIFHGNGIGT